jgi:putative ABC transport system permease protein
MASIDLPQVNVADGQAQAFYRSLVDRVSTLRGVEASGAGGRTAFWRFNDNGDDTSSVVWRPFDAPAQGTWHRGGLVIGDLFRVVGARLVQGRFFEPEDHVPVRPGVAVVNGAYARAQFGGAALGQVVRVGLSREDYDTAVDVTIVGVVEPTWRNEDGARPTRTALYLPVPLTPDPSLTVYARTPHPEALAGELRQVVRQIDGRVPILDVATLAERSSRAYPESWLAQAAGALGVLALALAAFGLAGLMSYLVTLRAKEMAVRLALGASPGRVLHMVVMSGLRLSATGGAIGLPLALLVGQVVRVEFHEAPGIDLPSLIISVALLVTAAVAASALPALRASRLSPLALLKEQ